MTPWGRHYYKWRKHSQESQVTHWRTLWVWFQNGVLTTTPHFTATEGLCLPSTYNVSEATQFDKHGFKYRGANIFFEHLLHARHRATQTKAHGKRKLNPLEKGEEGGDPFSILGGRKEEGPSEKEEAGKAIVLETTYYFIETSISMINPLALSHNTLTATFWLTAKFISTDTLKRQFRISLWLTQQLNKVLESKVLLASKSESPSFHNLPTKHLFVFHISEEGDFSLSAFQSSSVDIYQLWSFHVRLAVI